MRLSFPAYSTFKVFNNIQWEEELERLFTSYNAWLVKEYCREAKTPTFDKHLNGLVNSLRWSLQHHVIDFEMKSFRILSVELPRLCSFRVHINVIIIIENRIRSKELVCLCKRKSLRDYTTSSRRRFTTKVPLCSLSITPLKVLWSLI